MALPPPLSRDSADWLKCKLWLATEIQRLRKQLERTNASITEREHDVTRGRIAALSDFIMAVEPQKVTEREAVEPETLDSTSGY